MSDYSNYMIHMIWFNFYMELMPASFKSYMTYISGPFYKIASCHCFLLLRKVM